MKTRRKKTALVPRIVFGTAVLGVIPACAIACGGSVGGESHDAGNRDVVVFTVAAVGYCAYCDGGLDGVVDAFGGADVAFIGFDASDGAPHDASTDVKTPFDAPFSVAAVGFCTFCDAGKDEG